MSGAFRDKDRIESAKAGAVAGLGGVLGALPIQLATDSEPLALLSSSAPIFLSAALFGIVLRYAVKRWAGNLETFACDDPRNTLRTPSCCHA